MAEMTIRLIPDPATGKKNIVIALRSDADALPHEHEQMHRALVEKLVNGGLVKASEVGQIVVEREDKEGAAVPVETGPQGDRQAQKQGGSRRVRQTLPRTFAGERPQGPGPRHAGLQAERSWLMESEARHEVERLREQMRCVEPYPDGVRAIPARYPGALFFPGGMA